MDHDTSSLIDGLLDQHRPGRYDVGDIVWRAPVYAAIETRVTMVEARKIAARQLVDQREGSATRAANTVLRTIARDQQWPLGWMDIGRRPISVAGQRIRLDTAMAADFELWEVEERRSAATEFAARNEACNGAQWIAEQMIANGWHTFGDACAAQQQVAS